MADSPPAHSPLRGSSSSTGVGAGPAAAAQSRSHWMDDSDATYCQNEQCELGADGTGVAFSLKLRKHHCRFCGRIFCHKCAGSFITLTGRKAKKHPFRACKACHLRYQESTHKVQLALGSIQRALPESDPRVEEFRATKAKGWGASLPSWGSPAQVFECKVYVRPAEAGADPHSLKAFLTSVTFDLKPGLRTPREKFVQGAPYELDFLADAKGECKMTLTFKDGEQIHRHQVPLKAGAEEQAEEKRRQAEKRKQDLLDEKHQAIEKKRKTAGDDLDRWSAALRKAAGGTDEQLRAALVAILAEHKTIVERERV